MLGLIVLVFIAASAGLHGPIEDTVKKLSGVIGRHPFLGAAAFIGLAAVSVLLAAFSSTLLVPVGVDHWGAVVTLVFLWSGWIIGGIITYFVGIRLGNRVARWIANPKDVKLYQERITRKASFPLILLFQAAAPSEVVGYTLGTAKYRFLRYLAALALGELPYAFGAVFLGEGFMHRQYWLMVVLGIAGIGFMAWGAIRLNRILTAS